MSKSDKLNKTRGAAASRSKSAQKVLDSERRFIDDLAQQCLLMQSGRKFRRHFAGYCCRTKRTFPTPSIISTAKRFGVMVI